MNNRFGLPPFSSHNTAHILTVCVIAASIIQAIMMQSGFPLLYFIPLRVLSSLEIWRPFTSLFVAANGLEIIFGALIIYSIGGMLESRWGRQRFLLVALGIPLAAQFITLLLAFLFPTYLYLEMYASASSILTALWITYGLVAWFSRSQIGFWGTPLNGNTFALIGLGFVIIGAAFNGLRSVLPELMTAGLSYAYMYRAYMYGGKNDFIRRIELKYYNWKLSRLKNKRGLHVVKKSDPTSSDKNDPTRNIH